MVERNPAYEKAFQAMRTRNTLKKGLRRVGCGVIFVIWLGAMLAPCLFVTLLVRKEIVISRSDLPEHEYRLFLIEEEDHRGFGFSKGEIQSGGADEANFCIATSVDYLMWKGKAEPIDYCDCYEKLEDGWSATVMGGDKNCQPTEFIEP